jgi:hypothetical protein
MGSLVPDSVLGPLPADLVFGEPNPVVSPIASFRYCLCLVTFSFSFALVSLICVPLWCIEMD